MPHPVNSLHIGTFSGSHELFGPSPHLCLELGVESMWNRLHQFADWQAGLVALFGHTMALDQLCQHLILVVDLLG